MSESDGEGGPSSNQAQLNDDADRVLSESPVEEPRLNGFNETGTREHVNCSNVAQERIEGTSGDTEEGIKPGTDTLENGTSEDEDEGQESSDEEEEPALKYERLGNSAADLLGKDNASAVAVSSRFIALGTHNGIVHILDHLGNRIQSYRPHHATINEVCVDTTGEFVATASVDGQIIIRSLTTPESYAFDMRRPMRTISLDPSFAKNTSRTFVCGGMAGTFVMHEKGWLGHKETILHSGEGPIWSSKWRGNLIAWANDIGVKIYDTEVHARITFIDRPANSPRADLFKCNLHWQDDTTLLIGWADSIKVARIRARPRTSAAGNLPPLYAEITSAFQLDSMISGIVPHPTPPSVLHPISDAPKSFLVLAYIPPDKFVNEATIDPTEQARKAANRPELRIISRLGEELSSDELSLPDFHLFGCNDYSLAEAEALSGHCYVVLSPRSIILVRPRDKKDHVEWLVHRKRYEEALEAVTMLEDDGVDVTKIGEDYVKHLFDEGEFDKAAHLTPRVLDRNEELWETWIFRFAQQGHLDTIIPYVPIREPQLKGLVYEMILGHYIQRDVSALLRTIRAWPPNLYDVPAVIVAVQAEFDRMPSTSPQGSVLMECLAELYNMNRQPGKALPFLIRLRRPQVFEFIREHNLFTTVQDQALLLVELDQELTERNKKTGDNAETSIAIKLLVDHTHSIPVPRVVRQLQPRPYFLYLYLDALFDKDPQLVSEFTDLQIQLYADYQPSRLIDFLRASNYYSLEKAYAICQERDYVPEMVFLLGRMGNNKKALYLIIDRLKDVNRAIDFAKEQNDDDLWDDLLRYSETRPPFIRGLLENVGAQIDPIRLIRRIKNGLEIPGLKDALIKILQDFNLQISLLEGCQTILYSDCTDLARRLHNNQMKGFFENIGSTCMICSLPLNDASQSLSLLFLCRHVVHANCASGGQNIPRQSGVALLDMSTHGRSIGGKIAFATTVRARLNQGCPVCYRRNEGERGSYS